MLFNSLSGFEFEIEPDTKSQESKDINGQQPPAPTRNDLLGDLNRNRNFNGHEAITVLNHLTVEIDDFLFSLEGFVGESVLKHTKGINGRITQRH